MPPPQKQTSHSTLNTPLPNPSLQVTADHDLKQVDSPVREPGPGEVLLHIKATGICGSDVHFWKRGKIGSLEFKGDCIIGHEAAGVVLKCGPGVTNLKPGDRISLEPGVPCIHHSPPRTSQPCHLCTSGQYNLCQSVAFSGVYPHPGSLQRYLTHPSQYCHLLPPSLSYAEGALIEPLSVVLHGIRQAGSLSLGSPVLICGAGPIGLIALACARASGAWPIAITDVEESRLSFARTFVPGCLTYRIGQETDEGPKEAPEASARGIRRLFGLPEAKEQQQEEEEEEEDGELVVNDDYKAPAKVLECTGVESSIATAGYVARRGGMVMVIGVGKEKMNNLPFMHMSLAEFINRYRDTWPAGLSLLSSGILDLKPLISHTFPLEAAKQALEFSADLKNGPIKVQVVDEADDEAAWWKRHGSDGGVRLGPVGMENPRERSKGHANATPEMGRECGM
ncbi:hypothetical protein MKZ38_009656 [Zalerion maritima]|uniref:Enoyl reductase (ER) domain-containing protein n=1 Tax=Zalerion maritima TaxID=339359 RepID=A0AAD5WVL9_9PEZI|nr:hypothetical protein MKZ38_009656 [Zalerion maritima]